VSFRVYLWRCSGCGAVFGTDYPHRDNTVAPHHSMAPFCGHEIEPWLEVSNDGDVRGFDSDDEEKVPE
jgi:rubredoxin